MTHKDMKVLLMGISRNRLKKITEVNKKQICVLGETHRFIEPDRLLTLLGSDVFVDRKVTCGDCEQKVRLNYAYGVNQHKIDYQYEPFRDTAIETGFEKYDYYWHADINLETEEKLNKLQADLRAFNSEKKYDIRAVSEDQKIALLRKQCYYIEDFRNDRKTKTKFVIHLPVGRVFTLPFEAEAIQTLSRLPVETNFYKKYFAVLKDGEAVDGVEA